MAVTPLFLHKFHHRRTSTSMIPMARSEFKVSSLPDGDTFIIRIGIVLPTLCCNGQNHSKRTRIPAQRKNILLLTFYAA